MESEQAQQTTAETERGEHGEDGTASREERKPPLQCARLFDYFSGNEIAAKTNKYERANGGGAPDPERWLLHGRSVGFRQHTEAQLLDRAAAAIVLRDVRRKRGDVDAHGRPAWSELDEPKPFDDERVSHAQRYGGTAAIMTHLSALHRDVLRRRYGPQDLEPYLKMREVHALPAKDDPKRAAAIEVVKWNDRRRKLAGRTGPLGQVLPLTLVARDAYAAWCAEQAAAAGNGSAGAERRACGEQGHHAWSELLGDALASWRELSSRCGRLRGRASREVEQLGAVSEETLLTIARVESDRDAARAMYEETEARGVNAARQREALVATDPTPRHAPLTLVQFVADVLTGPTFERVLGAAKVEAYNEWVKPAWAAYEPLGVVRRRQPIRGGADFDRGEPPTEWLHHAEGDR